MGRSRMTFYKARLLPLAIYLLLCALFLVSGRPKTKHYLVQTKDNNYYIKHMNSYYPGNIDAGGKGYPAGSSKTKTIDDDISDIDNGGHVEVISDHSSNVGKDDNNTNTKTADDYIVNGLGGRKRWWGK